MQLKKHANVTIYQPATLKLLTQNENHTSLLLQIDGKEQTLFSTCIIAADGTASTVRAQLNIPVERIDYEQTALVVRTTLQRPHQHIAYERFVHIGAIAMLPLQDNADQPECATIWSGDNATIAHLMTLSANDFLGRLQKEFGYRLGRLQKIGTRYTYPLQMVKAQRSEVGHVLLLGNSAHTLHPIAAQGLNLALYEAAMLVEKIKMLRTLQRPLTAQDLAIVDKSFKQHQTISMSISHRLTQLFAKTSSVRSMLLSLGMLSLDILTPVKRKFINRMIGKSDRLPHLLLNMNETYVKKSG